MKKIYIICFVFSFVLNQLEKNIIIKTTSTAKIKKRNQTSGFMLHNRNERERKRLILSIGNRLASFHFSFHNNNII